MTAEEFGRQFNSRTLAYLPSYVDDGRPVTIVVGNAAHNPAGHLAATSLFNQVGRAHRVIRAVGDLDRKLLCRSPFGHETLAEATVGLATEINPLIDVEIVGSVPEDALITIGLAAPAELEVGADGWCAQFGSGANFTDQPETLLGAALASTLAAATAFHRLRGIPGFPEGSYSLWLGGKKGIEQGPSFAFVDVGRVFQVGAGAVGTALDFWLASVGYEGVWLVLDGDFVDASNLNRQLLYMARDVGFPDGEAIEKARATSERTGMRGLPYYYGDDRAGEAVEMFDLILPLANEGGVRPALQARPQPLLLHATTSTWWSAQLHRHIAGIDGCIVCRLPNQHDAAFTCTTGDVSQSGEKPMDASLPFLAAAAGLLLLMGLIRLQNNQLADEAVNQWNLSLETPEPVSSETAWQCRDGCRAQLPAQRRRERAAATRWAHLDRDED